MKAIQLSEHFDYKKLLRYAMPSILMMIVTSIYGVVDGLFVSNFAGTEAFAAVNFIMPFIMILGGFGFMIGTGGCALIGKTLGEKDEEKANNLFSMLIYITLIGGMIIAILGVVSVEKVAGLLGASADMQKLCGQYGRIVLCGVPLVMLQYEFQSFWAVAEKPRLGLYSSIISGVANIVLDALLVGVCGYGIQGAAVATMMSQVIGGCYPLIYFSRENSSLLRLGKATWDGRAFAKTVSNGSSEFVSNIAFSVVGMLYNVQLLKYAGENGVAAYGVLMYLSLVFSAIYLGFSVGTAPIVSYHFGAKNKEELKNLLRTSYKIVIILSISMFLAAKLLKTPIASVFVGYDEEVMELTVHAFSIYAFSFLLSAIPIYGSSFFTAINDGFTSAAISFLRTMVFQIGALMLLPLLLGTDGIWLSLIVAEIASSVICVIFLLLRKEKYGY